RLPTTSVFPYTTLFRSHHVLVKTNLFFAASAIARIGGGEDLKKTGGLYVKAPVLAVLFFIPAFSLGGIPPFSGFWAKLALLSEVDRKSTRLNSSHVKTS